MQWKYKNVCDLIFTWCTFVSEHYFIETGGLTHRFLIQRQDTCKLELNNWSGHRVANLVKQQSTKYFIFCTNLMIPMSDKHIFIKSEPEWTKWKYNFTFVTNNFAPTHSIVINGRARVWRRSYKKNQKIIKCRWT